MVTLLPGVVRHSNSSILFSQSPDTPMTKERLQREAPTREEPLCACDALSLCISCWPADGLPSDDVGLQHRLIAIQRQLSHPSIPPRNGRGLRGSAANRLLLDRAADLICRALRRRRCYVGISTVEISRGVIDLDATASMIAHGRLPGVCGR